MCNQTPNLARLRLVAMRTGGLSLPVSSHRVLSHAVRRSPGCSKDPQHVTPTTLVPTKMAQKLGIGRGFANRMGMRWREVL